MTGAFSPFSPKAIPSFILIEYKGSASMLTLYVYKFIDGQMDIGQTDIIKGGKMVVAQQEEASAGEEEEEEVTEEEEEDVTEEVQENEEPSQEASGEEL